MNAKKDPDRALTKLEAGLAGLVLTVLPTATLLTFPDMPFLLVILATVTNLALWSMVAAQALQLEDRAQLIVELERRLQQHREHLGPRQSPEDRARELLTDEEKEDLQAFFRDGLER